MKTKVCKKCGKEVEELDVCPFCGASLEETTDDLEQEVENTNEEVEQLEQLEQLEISEQPEKLEVNDSEKQNVNESVETNAKKTLNKDQKIKIGGCIALVVTTISSLSLFGQVNSLKTEISKLEESVTYYEAKAKSLEPYKDMYEELKFGADAQLSTIKSHFEKGEWAKVIELSTKLHEKYNGSSQDQEAQELATQSQAKLDEIEAAKKAEEAKGYETGITFNQLARTPDDYKGKKVKFKGKVLQVLEGDDSCDIRLAVNKDYDQVIYCTFDKNIISSRILEDDIITIYGSSIGIYSYTSTMGKTVSLPAIVVAKIDQ